MPCLAKGCLIALGAALAGLVLLLVLVVVVSVIIGKSTPVATPCSPAPCAYVNGLRIEVSQIDRDYQPPKPTFGPASSPNQGFHYVRLMVTVVDVQGQHDVGALVEIKDSLGLRASAPLFGDQGCSSWNEAVLNAGERSGPTPLCFQVAGTAKEPLALEWLPTSGNPNLTVIEIPLGG